MTDPLTTDPKLERDLEYFGEDSNFCPDCGNEWKRCHCGEDQDPYEAICESRFGLPGGGDIQR